jgi:hypothetical protein
MTDKKLTELIKELENINISTKPNMSAGLNINNAFYYNGFKYGIQYAIKLLKEVK